MLHSLFNFFNLTKEFKIQSFTYFIPSPPLRSTGYREKHFDKLFYTYINKGYKILSVNTQSISGEKCSGMWVVFIVQAKNKEAENLDLQLELNEIIKSNVDENIEGFYSIDEQIIQND